MSQRQSVRAIVIHDGGLLVMKRNKAGLQYYTRVGGGIDPGEDQETALRRELREETGMEVGMVRAVYYEDAGELYGLQHVYLCEYIGGNPVLSPESGEAAQTADGKNTYEPMWLPLDQVSNVTFYSVPQSEALLKGVRDGFPETLQELA